MQRKVLLVDDEQMIRTILRENLQREGYEVVEAADVDAALEVFPTITEGVGLLLTDVTMPVVSGGILAVTLRKIDSDLPVIFMSGHHTDPIVEAMVSDGKATYFGKPFKLADLFAEIKRVFRN